MDWIAILTKCGVSPAGAAHWAAVFEAEAGEDKFSLGHAEIDDFLGQVLHESAMLTHLEESLSYSAERLCAVWPHRFPTIEAASPFAHNPVELANHVYGGRLGNTEPGDGWLFRGRGLIQVTGRDNYTALARVLGLPLDVRPDMLARPEIALRSAVAWWERNVPDSVMGDIKRVTRAVNGGTVGLADREAITERADGALS